MALAICGETALAEKLVAQTSKKIRNATVWNAVQLPEVQSTIATNSGDPAKGIEWMSAAVPYERAYPDLRCKKTLSLNRVQFFVKSNTAPSAS